MNHKIELSIIIVNYNGKEVTANCLSSIFISKINHFEIIVVDNGSTDGSIPYLKNKFKKNLAKLYFLKLNKNFGPAKARNLAVKKATGKYLAFLDNDTKVEKNWTQKPLKIFKKNHHIGVIQCKLLLLEKPNRLDYIGDYLSQNGFLIQRAKPGTLDQKKFNNTAIIFAAKSAAMFTTLKIFKQIGGFDSDYFIYLEETDYCWRNWLRGYKTIFLPSSKVFHESGASTLVLGTTKKNFQAKYHGSKNYILTLIKNLETKNLIKFLPLHVSLWFGLACYKLFKGDYKTFFWINKGIFYNVLKIKKTLRKRKAIQKNRLISDKKLFKFILRKRPLKYFINKATKRTSLGKAKSF